MPARELAELRAFKATLIKKLQDRMSSMDTTAKEQLCQVIELFCLDLVGFEQQILQ